MEICVLSMELQKGERITDEMGVSVGSLQKGKR